jgi:GT2 family glycosyltransferase
LVDNGSEDDSVDFVAKHYPEVHILPLPSNLGFSAANNAAIETSRSEFVALLNNDAVPHPMWLKELVETLHNHPNAGFAASKMLAYENPNLIDRAGDGYTRAGTGLMVGHTRSADQYNQKTWIFGACAGAALYRTEMLDDIGLFDNDFFLLYEDVDLSFRAQLRGYKCIFVPEAVVYHRGSSTIIHDSPLSVYYGHRNLEWTYIKNMPTLLLFRTLLPHIIYDVAAFFYFALNGRSGEFMRSKWDAFKGLRRMLHKRRWIQANKKVDNAYVWGLLEKEFLFHRLKRRTKKVT